MGKKLNNNIVENHTSFEVSKLLRDKGFDVFCNATYTEYLKDTQYNKKGIVFEDGGFIKGRNSQHALLNNEFYDIVSAPTQAIAIEWLRVNYNLWIEASCHTIDDDNETEDDLYYFTVRNLNPVKVVYSGDFVDLPQEAIDAALIYVLTNIILNISVS